MNDNYIPLLDLTQRIQRLVSADKLSVNDPLQKVCMEVGILFGIIDGYQKGNYIPVNVDIVGEVYEVEAAILGKLFNINAYKHFHIFTSPNNNE